MTSAELTELLVNQKFDPLGNDRGDLQAGVVAAAIVNQWRKEGSRAVSPLDMVPDWGGLRRKAEAERASSIEGHRERWQQIAEETQGGAVAGCLAAYRPLAVKVEVLPGGKMRTLSEG